MDDADDYEYFVPLEDQRVFGAGIKRKGIAFVPAASSKSITQPVPSQTASEKYLSVVLAKNNELRPGRIDSIEEKDIVESANKTGPAICPVCKQPLNDANDTISNDLHATSIAHQVCLEHSHPPSHLDRNYAGLKYLSSYGWDPDTRQGLGVRQEGIRYPIKAKEKNNTAGLGLFSNTEDALLAKVKPSSKQPSPKVVRLNAKEIRKMEKDKAKRADKLRQAFYSDDLSQYLGPA